MYALDSQETLRSMHRGTDVENLKLTLLKKAVAETGLQSLRLSALNLPQGSVKIVPNFYEDEFKLCFTHPVTSGFPAWFEEEIVNRVTFLAKLENSAKQCP